MVRALLTDAERVVSHDDRLGPKGPGTNLPSSWSVLAIAGAFAGVILLSRRAAWNDVDYLIDLISTTLPARDSRAA